MAKKRFTADDPGQGRLFSLTPQVKPLEDDAPGAHRKKQQLQPGEKDTGERFQPPVNWIEDEHD